MLRLFVALRPPLPIRDRLMATMNGVAGARWQDDGQLHVTLRFIGEVDERTAADIDAALSMVSACPLRLQVGGVGIFDHRGRSSAIWAGVAPRDALTALHRKIDTAIVRAGLTPERRAYLPHITLARLNAASDSTTGWLADHAGLDSEPWITHAFHLYASHLGKEGARYESIVRYPLAAHQ